MQPCPLGSEAVATCLAALAVHEETFVSAKGPLGGGTDIASGHEVMAAGEAVRFLPHSYRRTRRQRQQIYFRGQLQPIRSKYFSACLCVVKSGFFIKFVGASRVQRLAFLRDFAMEFRTGTLLVSMNAVQTMPRTRTRPNGRFGPEAVIYQVRQLSTYYQQEEPSGSGTTC